MARLPKTAQGGYRKITAYLEVKLVQEVKILAVRQERTISEIVGEALAAYLTQAKGKTPS